VIVSVSRSANSRTACSRGSPARSGCNLTRINQRNSAPRPDSESSSAGEPHRSAHRSPRRQPTAHEHPARHSYAETPLGPPTSVALPARTTLSRQPTFTYARGPSHQPPYGLGDCRRPDAPHAGTGAVSARRYEVALANGSRSAIGQWTRCARPSSDGLWFVDAGYCPLG
jgi:hypothetical protein